MAVCCCLGTGLLSCLDAASRHVCLVLGVAFVASLILFSFVGIVVLGILDLILGAWGLLYCIWFVCLDWFYLFVVLVCYAGLLCVLFLLV